MIKTDIKLYMHVNEDQQQHQQQDYILPKIY